MEPSMSSLSWSALPLDLLLEISARSNPVTLVRCAATCKALRRETADPAFHARLRLRHADQFVPRLLRGFFLQDLEVLEGGHPRFVVPQHPMDPSPEPFRSFLSEYVTLFDFYHGDMAGSRGLVTLRCDTPDGSMARPGPGGACVFNPMTGYTCCLGQPKIKAQSYVLLTSDDKDGGECHYLLLAAELAPVGRIRTQAFSQDQDACPRWQPVTETAVAPCPPEDAALLRRPPLVLQGDDAHWLCGSSEYHFVLRLSCACEHKLQASVTKIDGRCGEQLLGRRPEELLLVSDGQGGKQPRLLVATGLQISLWTLSSDDYGEGGGGWSMQVLVEPERIRCGAPPGPWSERLELRWFGEKSGCVFVRMFGAPAEEESSSPSTSWYFVLELLPERRIRGLCKRSLARDELVFFPYEMDLPFWHPSFTRQLQ